MLHKIFLLPIIFCMFFILACAPKARPPEAVLDTPEHHVSSGNKFLDEKKTDEALREFNLAKSLDPEFSPAYAGIALVYAYKDDFKKSLDTIDDAADYAETDEHKLCTNIAKIRIYTIGNTKISNKWLKSAKKAYKKAININTESSAAHYFMAIAYKTEYKFGDSAHLLRKVLDLQKDYVEEANIEYEVIQKIERAMPGTKVGKIIALLDKITRADVSALFIEELEIDRLFKRKTPKIFDASYKNPEKKFNTGQYIKTPPATDIENHVLKTDINAVIKIGIKGLQPGPDHTFQPYAHITRAEFAMMVEDILIKITNNTKLATKFIGSTSPFPDLRSSLSYYNAAMVCSTRGIMKAQDLSTGEFKPMGNVSGADALLSLRELKIQLNKN